jgi:predicted  nucleic acid-binding Zn-ribbon protein
MANTTTIEIPAGLLEAIESFPTMRDVTHCDRTFAVSSFHFYADCPKCGTRIKLRAFSAGTELEDVFDAVFAWMNQPGAAALANQRRKTIAADEEEQGVLDKPVSDLNLSVRTQKTMKRLGISTLGDLVQRFADERLESKDFGMNTLNEIRKRLNQQGISLRGQKN